MATENKETKFSELGLITSFTGKEIVPMAYLGTNPAATLEALKTYMADSALQFFARIITTAVPVGGAMPDLTEGDIAIVYLSYYKTFALEKTVRGASSYYLTFTSKDNYMEGNKVRTDRIFLCLANEKMYKSNEEGMFNDLFSPVVLTQAEYDALPVKDENKTYYIVEE